ELHQYADEIRQLQHEYQSRIQLFLALEMDYVPEMSQPFAQLKAKAGLDYVIGSVHLVGKGNPETLWFTDGPDASIYDRGLADFYDNDIKKGVKAFFDQTNEMIEKEVFDVIGHFDKIKMHNQNRYFTEREKWYRDHIFETLRLIQSKGLIVEINTRGIYKKRCDSLYPSGWILHEMKQMNIPIVISSDAHHPDELMAEFPRAVEAAQAAGYQTVMSFNNGHWHEQAID
ncbi:MAG: histidinol-phosphatase, partial [Bacteroidales bacterium]|nr:histidinol-phosphatase [Bacteroidales bacterium]